MEGYKSNGWSEGSKRRTAVTNPSFHLQHTVLKLFKKLLMYTRQKEKSFRQNEHGQKKEGTLLVMLKMKEPRV
jgi:hypothetical protein